MPWEPRGYSRKRSRDYRPPGSMPELCEHHVKSGSQVDESHGRHVWSHDGMRDERIKINRASELFVEGDVKLDVEQKTDFKEPSNDVKDPRLRDTAVNEPVTKRLNKSMLEGVMTSQDITHDVQILKDAESKSNALHLDYSSSSSESSDENDATKIKRSC